ncbi:hypothetical protein [Thermoflexus hugenholtzii]
MRRWIPGILILSLTACLHSAAPITPVRTATPTIATGPLGTQPARTPSPTPTPIPATATPTATRPPTRTPTATPRPTRLPSAPPPSSGSQRPQPLPDGFQTEGNWIAVFRPRLERQTWSEGAVWLTDGQRWIGPWPSDLTMPFWTLWNGRLHFCYWRDGEWFEELATTNVPPICVEAPDGLAIRRDRIGPKENDIHHLKPCGSPGELCAPIPPDKRLSPPLRFPIPESVILNQVKVYDRVQARGCLSPDQRHALIVVYRDGGPMSEGEELFRKVVPDFTPPPLTFPGGLYWVDLHSGKVLTAPTNAPGWPDQQALARALAEQERFPVAFLPFLRSALGPTQAGPGCSPDGRFALAMQALWLPPGEVYLPADVRRYPEFFGHDFRPPPYATLWWIWVIRIEDGTGYPITLLEDLFNTELSHAIVDWVPFYMLPRDMPQVPLPPRASEPPSPWKAP